MKIASWLIMAVLLMAHGIGKAEIIVGQTAGFTGAAAPGVEAMTQGAMLIIGAVNERGGIRGERIKLVSLDDGNNVKRAGENAKRLIEESKAVALFLSRGTPHTAEMVPTLKEYGVPLIGPSTGAMQFVAPVIREVFNTRPSYQYEAERTVSQMAAMNLGERIGVIYAGDAFGADALVGLQKGFTAIKQQPAFVVPYDTATEDTTEGLRKATTVVNGKHPSVIIVGTSRVTTALIKQIRTAGNTGGYIATLSTNASEGFIQGLGQHADYIMVSQAFPSERALQYPIVQKVAGLLKAAGRSDQLSPAILEGAVAAEVLVEGLRRCETPCTSAKLIAALENGKPIPVGMIGQDIVYSRSSHSGLRYSDTAIIVGGQFKR